jgi:hypothetical protein
MSEAICDVLASIATDVLIFRKILAEKNLISDAEYETALEVLERHLGKATGNRSASQALPFQYRSAHGAKPQSWSLRQFPISDGFFP